MRDYLKYMISENATIINALDKLNGLSADVLTLFVVAGDKCELGAKMVGTLTDGDVRRAIIEKKSLESKIEAIINRKFVYLKEGEFDIETLKRIRERRALLVPILNSNREIKGVRNFKHHKSYIPIDAVLMAGGKGERLRPLTESLPKPLLPVGGSPIIDFNIDNILNYGVDNISITVNYLAEKIENYIEQAYKNLEGQASVTCIREPEFLGTIGALRLESLKSNLKKDTVFVMNSDLFTDVDIEDFYLSFLESGADMSIGTISYSVKVPFGVLETNGDKVVSLKEKPTYNYDANAGIYLIKRSVLEMIPQGIFFQATDFIELLIEKGMLVTRFPIMGTWVDIGTPEEYKKVQDMVSHNRNTLSNR